MLTEVSLLIPCFNSEKTLSNLLEDAVNQEYPFAEIIVYDDGSTDNTSLIAEQFGCRVVREEINRGAGYARQKLLDLAKSSYIHFHDSDDRLDKNFLQVLAPYCAKNRVVCCSLKEILKNRKVVLHQYHEINKEIDLIAYIINNFIHMNTCIYHRESALKSGGFHTDLRTNEDRVFHYQIVANGQHFYYVDQPLVCQIRNSMSTLSNTKFSLIINNFLKGIEIALDLFPEQYHSLLGNYVLFYLEKIIYKNDYQLADEAIKIAKQCGVRSLNTSSSLANNLSRLIGIKNTLLIRKKYANLRKYFGIQE